MGPGEVAGGPQGEGRARPFWAPGSFPAETLSGRRVCVVERLGGEPAAPAGSRRARPQRNGQRAGSPGGVQLLEAGIVSSRRASGLVPPPSLSSALSLGTNFLPRPQRSSRKWEGGCCEGQVTEVGVLYGAAGKRWGRLASWPDRLPALRGLQPGSPRARVESGAWLRPLPAALAACSPRGGGVLRSEAEGRGLEGVGPGTGAASILRPGRVQAQGYSPKGLPVGCSVASPKGKG